MWRATSRNNWSGSKSRLDVWLLLLMILLLAGCTTRVVVIDRSSDVVRLGKGVKGEIYVLRDGEWVSIGKAVLPEGWYAGPGPESE
jgi:hypothetical protein